MSERILVIDDEEDIRNNMYEYFTELKYRVFLAEDGESAKSLLLERKVDIILLDLILPDTDGLTLLEWIKNHPRTYNIPVIIISARGDNETKVEGLAKGADDFIAKPYNLIEVTARVRKILKRAQKQSLNPLIHSLSDWYNEGGVLNLKEQLEISSHIQKTLLPRKFPELDGYDVSAMINPAQFIGGDFYDFFQIAPHKYLIVLGDVTGRGIPAAIMMVITRSFLRLSKIWNNLSPLTIIKRLNALLVQDIPSDMFVTLFYVQLDEESSSLQWVSTGGLTQPLYYSKNKNTIEFIPAYGAMIGMFDDQELDIYEINIDKGDVLVLYTDGIISTLNDDGIVYSRDRLKEIINNNLSEPSRIICKSVLEDVKNFAGEKTIEDDIALLVIKKTE